MSSVFSKTITLRKDIRVTDAEFTSLRDFIYAQSGIHIADNRKYLLENRLANRLRDWNLNSFGEYFHFLKYDPGRRQELTKLFEAITTNETSFYRNPPQIKVFQDTILKSIVDDLRRKKERRLRIWSAGCSTGEEPYTLSIILHEILKSEINLWDVVITANDLSEAVLQSANAGVYSDYTLRTTPKDIIAQYFMSDGSGRYKVKPELKKIISFSPLNLSDRFQIKRVERSHVIFCRNVIIYFDDEMKKQVISSFYDNLLPGGYLFVGHSESLHNLSRAFKPEHYSGAIVYKREV